MIRFEKDMAGSMEPDENGQWVLYQDAIQPIDMVLHCPTCGMQHIDKPNRLENIVHRSSGTVVDQLLTNPPHRSHLCHGCHYIWRPADVPTNGVAAVKTVGKADSPIVKNATSS